MVLLDLVGGSGLIVALTHGSPPSAVPPVQARSFHVAASAGQLQPGYPADATVTKRARQQAATHKPTVHLAQKNTTASGDAQASFVRLSARLPGAAGVAVAQLGDGPIKTFGSLQVADAWSTSKVPVLTTLLVDYAHTGQALSPKEQTEATLALTQSDNAAMEELFGQLEQIHGGLAPASAAVQQLLRSAGDETTIINTTPNNHGLTTYGQSEWSATGEVQFYRALADGCLLDSQDTAYILGLMRNVIPSQRWGAGAAGYPTDLSLAFKGGWGPASNGGYQVRQTEIVGTGNDGYVASVIAVPASGTFTDGTNMVTSLATWAREHFAPDANTPPAACAASGAGNAGKASSAASQLP